jgi:hypothetical protein
VRPGITAPVGHGHGGAGFDLGLATGVEYASDRVRAAGGGDFGPRIVDDNPYEPIALEAHAAIPLAGSDESQHRLILVTRAMAGAGLGLAKSGPGMQPTAPSGGLVEGFAGIGVGALTEQRSPRIVAGHVAIGLSARRFWPEHGDAFWMIGVALDLSYSWQNGGQWAH